MTQAQAVIETIDNLGGIATLNQINQHVFNGHHIKVQPVYEWSLEIGM